ncbi:MAG: GNAT family N-acetyltransferase [candidate division WOR-3 bacterium]|nr:MAG: GNAT family N-acetyltransferase [candidate division WOR-3 bacterium]
MTRPEPVRLHFRGAAAWPRWLKPDHDKSDPGLFRVDREHVDQVLDRTVCAFYEDPLWAGILPDRQTRYSKMCALFGFLLRFGVMFGEVYAPSEELEGVAVWLPEKYARSDGWPAFRAGALSIMFRVDMPSLGRLAAVGRHTSAQRRKHLPGPHWYLALLGVGPEFQGRGFGRRLLWPMLDRLDQENLPVWLDTETEENVRYYERIGFEVRDDHVVPEADVRLWGMCRTPGRKPDINSMDD